jgi:hypothetical protein
VQLSSHLCLTPAACLQVDEVVSINKRYRQEYADKVKARKVCV